MEIGIRLSRISFVAMLVLTSIGSGGCELEVDETDENFMGQEQDPEDYRDQAYIKWFLHEAEQIDQVLWSDDDTGQAYVKLLFLEGPALPFWDTTYKEDFRHQVFVRNADGTGDIAL